MDSRCKGLREQHVYELWFSRQVGRKGGQVKVCEVLCLFVFQIQRMSVIKE